MDTLLPIACGLLGAVLASFIGVIAERVGTGESWVRGRSRCNSCGKDLAPAELVPIAAWLSTGGRASCCGVRLPIAYVVSEILLAVSFYFAALMLGPTLLLPVFLVALSILAFIVLYDLRHTIVSSGASGFFVAVAGLCAYLTATDTYSLGIACLIAGSIGLAFFLLYILSRGRAMGLGDSPVALGLSLLVGSAALPGLVFSFWIGALCGIAILVRTPRGHRMGIEVPFVPFLAAGYLLAYFTQWTPFLF